MATDEATRLAGEAAVARTVEALKARNMDAMVTHSHQEALDKLKEMVTRPLNGLRLAPFYGCYIVRPTEALDIELPFDTIPTARFSEIEPSGGDVDYYRFWAAAGQMLSAEILSGALDSLIGLFGPDGDLIAMDDDGGVGLLSEIMYEISESVFHYLAVTTYPDSDFDGNGGTGGRYVLRINLIEANESRVGIVTDTD